MRYYGKDERDPLKLKPGKVLSNNPDARRNGFDARNGDVIVKDKDGNVKKVIKNKAQYNQKHTGPWRDWNTTK